MRFANLIQKVLDFINLGKVAVDAAPGVVLAFALGLITVSIVRVPVLPFARGEAEVICGEESAPQEKNRFETRLCGVWELVQAQQKLVSNALAAKGEIEKQVGTLDTEMLRIEAELQDLRKTRQARLVGDVIGTPGLEAEIRNLETRRKRIAGKLQTLAPEKISREQEAARAQARLDALHARLSEVQKGGIGSLGDLFEFLLDHLIALALIGWALGIVLNPLNRGFLTWGQAEPVKKAATRKIEALVLRKGRATVPLPDEEDLKNLLSEHGISYFLGRKIVSKEEWDGLVSSYYRWAELSSNLAVPLFALGIAFIVVVCRSNDLVFGVLGWVVAAPVCFVLSYLVYRKGKAGYLLYKEQEQDFLLGRLEQVLLAARQADLAQTLEATATKLIDVFRELIKQAEGAKS